MSKGYHQLQLKESSRNVATFSTHTGLYRYKRLDYGMRLAAEIFQETTREALTQDLKGVFNISDDIIVHGRDTKDKLSFVSRPWTMMSSLMLKTPLRSYDANLEALLKKSREKNVTFNKAKCEFNKESMLYYGLGLKRGSIPRPLQCTGYQIGRTP